MNDVAGQGGGVIQGTASEAVLVVLLAARDNALKRVGKNSLEKLVVYASDQTHSALQKACQVSLKCALTCNFLTFIFTSLWSIFLFYPEHFIFKCFLLTLVRLFRIHVIKPERTYE